MRYGWNCSFLLWALGKKEDVVKDPLLLIRLVRSERFLHEMIDFGNAIFIMAK